MFLNETDLGTTNAIVTLFIIGLYRIPGSCRRGALYEISSIALPGEGV